MRFLDQFLRSVSESAAESVRNRTKTMPPGNIQRLAHLMTRPETKRVILDGRQWTQFLRFEEPVPAEWQRQLHYPFDSLIYTEPTQPIHLGQTTSGEEITLRGLLVDAGESYLQTPPGYVSHTVIFTTASPGTGDGALGVKSAAYAYRISDGDTLRATGEPDDSGNGIAFGRMYAYMQSKGIEIVEERPASRQQRRLLARHKPPNPWHVVRVDPRYRDQATPDIADDDYQRTHGHRYDVMGHIRFGRHLLRDGKQKYTLEWVRPHQRGLRHELYIPATRRYTGDRPAFPALPEEPAC